MLSLSRTLRMGARGCAASLAAPTGLGALPDASGGRWGSEEGKAALSRLAAGPLTGASSRREEEEKRAPQAGLHTGMPTLQQAPGGGGSGTPLAESGSGGYALLAGLHAGAALTCFIAPTALAGFYFTGGVLPEGFQSQALVKLLGCGLGAGAASALGLKQLADSNQLASPTAQRLQKGLMGFAAGNIALHALYSPSVAGAALAGGAAVMALTAAVPYQHYTKVQGGLKVGAMVRGYLGAIPDHLRVSGLQSGLYTLLTPTLALAGASYLFAPGESLSQVFGFVKGVDAFFFWQVIGAGLMTVGPAVTFSLKKLAEEGKLGQAWAKTLNAGLLAAAAGHLAVLGPMVAANQGGPWLPTVAGAWALAALAGGLGLMGPSAAAGAKA